MIRIARSSIRHPRAAVAVWLVLALALGLVGTQLESRFSPSILVAKGTPSAKAHDLAEGYFGDSQLTPIMLSGPAKQLDQQGPTLVAHLRARGDTAVLSPFEDTPGTEVLRPKPTEATIIASVERSEEYVIDTALPQIHQAVDNLIKDGVTAHVTGQASIDSAVRDESISQTKLATAIAIPVVFLVLLIILRAPVGALIVTGFAATLLPVGYGLTAIAANIIPVDAVAAAGAAMVGLALAVGFGFLMVSRFRERLPAGSRDPAASAQAAVESTTSAGRAVLLGATALVAAMILASLLSMPEILNSIGIGATLMAAAAAAGAVGALPAMLRLTGPRIEAGSFGPKPWMHDKPTHAARAALPAVLAGVALAGMVALSLPVLDMQAGPPGPKMLPKDNQARVDYEAVAASMGEGWLNPFEIIVAKDGKPITTETYLGQLQKYEKALHRDKQVDSVMGPGMLFANAEELQGIPEGLDTAAATAKKSKKELKKLIAGLKLATDGVAQLRGGLGEAASGAGQLHGGTGQASSGGGQLASGLSQADAGAQQLKAGAAAAAEGAKELAGGLELAKSGVSSGLPALDGLIQAAENNAAQVAALGDAVASTTAQIGNAAGALANMTSGKEDPAYGVAVSSVESAAATNQKLAGEITAAAQGAQMNATAIAVVKSQVQELEAGIGKLLNGSNQLSAGLAKLSAGNSDLASGLAQLDAGGAKLQDGLSQLNAGAGALAAGLASGAGPSGELLAGMNEITGAVVESRKKIPSTAALEKLKQEAPGLFDSGYFVMAALDGAPTASRDAASFVVNVDNGGTAGRITVVPKQGADKAASEGLYDRLQESSAAFAKATSSEAAVGGTGANLIDYKTTGLDKLPIVIGALAALTLLMLAIVSRSILVPAVSVVLSLLTATASFGTLWLLYGGSDPVLGGSGAIDPVTMIAVSTVILGLAIIYEVFSVEHLHRMAGAGLAMLGVLLAFIPAELTLISQFAIGMAVAVLLDTLVVRQVMSRIDRRRRPPVPPEPGAPMPKPSLDGSHVPLRRPRMPQHVHLTRRQ